MWGCGVSGSRAVLVLAGAFVTLAVAVPPAAARPTRTGPKGIALIKHFEGYYPARYLDPVGVVTQCYGATGAELAGLPAYATEAQCDAALRRTLAARYEPAVRALNLGSQHRFDAIVSFVYNVGTGGVSASTGIGRALRARQWRRAADELLRWTKAGGRVLPGLVRRRQAERELFLTPDPVIMPGFAARSRVFISRFDRHQQAGRRAPNLLCRRMRHQARRVQAAARRTGWDQRRRAVRYRALRRRALNQEMCR